MQVSNKPRYKRKNVGIKDIRKESGEKCTVQPKSINYILKNELTVKEKIS